MEDRITYEIWMQSIDGKWHPIVDADSNTYFSNKKRAMLVGSNAAADQDAVEVVVIERRPILFLNGTGKSRPAEKPKGTPRKLQGVTLGDEVRGVDPADGRDPGADDGRARAADPVPEQAGDGSPGS
jgi:hypothetical protein